MEQKRVDEYKARLEAERRLLLSEIEQNEKPADFGHDTENPDEEIDASEDFGNQIAMVRGLKNRLDEIDVALGKIREGKYGICEKCGNEIGKDLLEIDPESRLCKHCKLGK